MEASDKVMYPCVAPGHTKAVVELCYSESTADGLFFLSACLDKFPMLRDAISGDWIGNFEGHKGAVWSARMNGDASCVATGSADFSAKIWNGLDGSCLATLAHKHIVKSVDFSPNGKMVATGCVDKHLRIFSVEKCIASKGENENASIDIEHSDKLRKVVWLTNQLLLSATEDGTVRLWDIGNTLKPLREATTSAGLMDVELSRDRRVFTVAAGSGVYFLDVNTLERVLRPEPVSVPFVIESASLHPGGHTVIAGGSDTTVREYSVATGQEIACHKGHHGAVHTVRFSPDGTTFSSGADDATIRIWKPVGSS